jgi:hypothetical protein
MAQEEFGQRVWLFPDGDLPPAGDESFKGHESLIILNPNDRDGEVTLTVYFEDREPASPPAPTKSEAGASHPHSVWSRNSNELRYRSLCSRLYFSSAFSKTPIEHTIAI